MFLHRLFFQVVLCVVVLARAKEAEKHKRHLFGEANFGLHTSGNLFLGGLFGHKHSNLVDASYGSKYGHLGGVSYGGNYGYGYGHHGLIDLGSYVHKHVTITKKIAVPVPQPYPVHIVKKIPVPVPHPVPVPVDKPYPVHVPRPYPVPVEKPVPYTVIKPVPVPVKVPIRVPVAVPVPISVPHPVPVAIHKPVPVALHGTIQESFARQPTPVIAQQYVQQAAVAQKPVAVGSGSLGVVRLANGKFVLGSGSLGYSQGSQAGRFAVATAVQSQSLSTGDKLQQTSPQVFTPAAEEAAIQVGSNDQNGETVANVVVQNGYNVGNEGYNYQNLGHSYDATLGYENTAVPFCGHENTVVH